MCGVYGIDVETLVEEMVDAFQSVVEEMVDAFQSVLIVLPRGPSDNENYSLFIEQTRTCSYNPPFCAPTPPFKNMKVPVSYTATFIIIIVIIIYLISN